MGSKNVWAFGQPLLDSIEPMHCVALAIHQFDQSLTGLQNNNCRANLPVICISKYYYIGSNIRITITTS